MITNFYSFFFIKKIIIIKNNCGCSPEPEFIEEIVGIIWEILYEESRTSTIPPCRQNDAPGQCSSLIIPPKGTLSGETAIAERTRLFFFFQKKNYPTLTQMVEDIGSKTPPLKFSWRSLYRALPFNFQLKIIKSGHVLRIQHVQWVTEQKLSPFHYFFKLLIKKSSRVSGPVLRRLQLVQTKLNRPLDAIASESHSSSGLFIPLPPLFIAIAHCHPLFLLFYLPNFFSFAQFNSVLLCFFVCP